MDQSKIKEILSNILSQLALNEDQIAIELADDENVNISLILPQESAGVFVGHHGEGLSALRMIFSLIIFQRFGVWPKLHLNVNDYQERREETLKELAQDAAERAVSLQKGIIHMFLSEFPGIKTESRGEAPFRQMVIVPQN